MEYLYIALGLFVVLFIAVKIFLSIIDKSNAADWGHGLTNRIDGLIRMFCHRFHRLPQKYIPLPESGPAIVAANHMSGLDPLLLVAASQRPLRFLIARDEYERFGLNWVFKLAGCIPVDRASNPEKALRQAFLALDRGEVIAIFPQGGIHWPITDATPFRMKGGAVRLAQRKKVPLIPVVVNGIGLKGSTMGAVIKRSDATLYFHDPINAEELSYTECMDVLAQKLNAA